MNIDKEDNKEAILINNKSDSKVSNSYNSNIYDVDTAIKLQNTTQIMKLIDGFIDTVKCFKNSTLNLLKCWEVSYENIVSDARSNESDNSRLSGRVKAQHLAHD